MDKLMTVILKGSFDTEVFVAAGGHIGIQQADPLNNVDSLILLSPAQLPLVIQELQALYERRACWERGESVFPEASDDGSMLDEALQKVG